MGFKVQVSRSRFQGPGFRFQVSYPYGTICFTVQGTGVRFQVPGFRLRLIKQYYIIYENEDFNKYAGSDAANQLCSG